MATKDFIIYLLVMAGITYLLRALPLVLVRKKITNTFVLSFLHYIPYAVLSVMTVPAIFFATGSVITASVGFVTALVLVYFKRSLIIVAAGACVGAFLTELLLMLIR